MQGLLGAYLTPKDPCFQNLDGHWSNLITNIKISNFDI